MTIVKSPRDRRHVTILFADTVGSTDLIQKLDPESAHRLLSPAIEIMASEIRRASGHVSQVLGDGIMGIFGVPFVLEDHATRAALAALAIQERVAQYAKEVLSLHGLKFQVRIGLNSGSVIVSASGDGDNELFDALGSPVHLASRIESKTPASGICVSQHTHDLIAVDFELKRLGTFTLKGFTAPETIHLLLRVRSTIPKRHLVQAPADRQPMVGREEPAQRLNAVVRRAEQEDVGGLVLVTGEAGVGKSRFVLECQRQFESVLWLQGQSSSYDQRLGFWPFVEMLKGWLELSDGGTDDDHWQGLVTRLTASLGSEADEVIPYVASMMGFEIREPYVDRVRYLDVGTLGAQILGAVRRLLEKLVESRATVIVIDDFHWSDQSSAELAGHLLGLCMHHGLVICALSRPDEGPAQQLLRVAKAIPGLDVTPIELSPLRIEDSILLLESLVGKGADLAGARDQILYKAGGNPFFIEEVVHSLIASGALVKSVPAASYTMTTHTVSIPDTIQDVIMARVDRLDARLKQLLHVASVIGRNFLYSVLKTAARHDSTIDEELSELHQRQLIDQSALLPEIAYMFRHALTQEAIYGSLLSEKRTKLHKQVADSLLEVFAGRTQRVASILAFHYARAQQPQEALRYLLEAAEQSLKMAADAEALNYYEEALETYAKVQGATWEPWQKATVECRLGEAHFHRGNLVQANAHFEQALLACSDAMPRSRAALLMAFSGQLLLQLGLRCFGRKVAKAGDAPTPLAQVRYKTYQAYSWALLFIDLDRTGYTILRILNSSEKLSFGFGMVAGSSGFGATFDIIGLNRLAHGYHRRALQWAQDSSNIAGRGIARTFFALHQVHVGRWPEALANFESARMDLEQIGDLFTWTATGVYQALVHLERGEFSAAMVLGSERIQQGRSTAHEMALRTGLMICGMVARRLKQLEPARILLGEALRHCNAAADHLNATQIRGELAHCLCELGQVEAADALLQEAMAVIRKHKVITYVATYALLARVQLALTRIEAGTASRPGKALGYSRGAERFSSRFRIGLVQQQRMLGTLHWLRGDTTAAQRSWQRSLATAQMLGADYEGTLTMREQAHRMQAADDLANADQALARFAEGTDIPAVLTQAGLDAQNRYS